MIKRKLAALRTVAEQRLRLHLRSTEVPGRALEVRFGDTFIVSYPKSGNTWLRFLVASLLHPESPTDFDNVDRRCPTIYNTTTAQLDALPSPRIMKSHEYFDPRYPRVIYVVRDPRDVIVSYLYYLRRKGAIGEQPIEEFVQQFVVGTLNGFGTWHENVSSWLAARKGDDTFLLIRYEDLLSRTVDELARIAQFLACDPDPTQLVRVVEQCSFEKMRAAERKAEDRSPNLKRVRNDIKFVREGKSGGWRSDLSPLALSRVPTSWKILMDELGYQD